MVTQAVILAGGFGTRLQSVVSNIPKPLAPVNGRPFLDYLMRYLRHYGIKNIVLSVGYLGEKIKEAYGNNFEGIALNYAPEKEPLGTGGGIRLSLAQCHSGTVLVLNGDSFFDINLENFISAHANSSSSASLALRQVENSARYGTISVEPDAVIISFTEKNGQNSPGLINTGVYLLNRDHFMEHTPAGTNFSVEKDFFEPQAAKRAIYGFEYNGYFIDIGIPDDYARAQHEFKAFKY